MDCATGPTGGDPRSECVRAGRGHVDRVLHPFAAVGPADIEAAAGVRARLDVDTVGAVRAAAVDGVAVVVGEAFAASVVVLSLDRAGDGPRRAEVRGFGRPAAGGNLDRRAVVGDGLGAVVD